MSFGGGNKREDMGGNGRGEKNVGTDKRRGRGKGRRSLEEGMLK